MSLDFVAELTILAMALRVFIVSGKSSPKRNFPGFRFHEQACLNSWLKFGFKASLRLNESSLLR